MSFYSTEDAEGKRLRETLELLARRTREENIVLIHVLGVRYGPRASASHWQGIPSARSRASVPGTGHVCLPEVGVCLEVDDDVGLLTGLVHDKSNAFHEPPWDSVSIVS